jgi:HD-GYP domain-containing protein (c-di-GMP phosphodiesterase class II)
MTEPGEPQQVTTTSIVIAVLTLATMIGAGTASISLYVKRERERDLQQWESRLGLAADARAAALADFTKRDLTGLKEMAGNASLQLYLSRLGTADADGDSIGAARSYLRNLLLAGAARMGYGDAVEAPIGANLSQRGGSGLVLLDRDLSPVAQTSGTPRLTPEILAAATAAISGNAAGVSTLHRDDDDRLLFAQAVAVPALLGTADAAAEKSIGVLIGIRNAAQGLLATLHRDTFFREDSEALLLTARGNQVVYLSATRDGTQALRRALPLSRDRLAAAAAVTDPGRFAELDNYQGRPVLQVSRRVRGQPWVLAQQVDARQAMHESDQRRRFLFVSLLLLLIAVVATTVAAWRHGSSVRSRDRATELEARRQELARQTELLNLITGNVDALILLVDAAGTLRYANESAGRQFDLGAGTAGHGALVRATGQDTGRRLQRGIARAQAEAAAVTALIRLNSDDQLRTFQARFTPVPPGQGLDGATLVVLSDVTELEKAQARHAQLLRRLVGSLVDLIDLHDPYSAFHSTRMAEVAEALAGELELPDADRRTLEFAALLSNIGKIRLPRDLLTKTDPLDQEERLLMESHVQLGLDLLTRLDFEGPVLGTIAQKQEHLDGSGYPRGLAAEELTLPGRILAVANAFVALVSPRAWRDALSVPDALDEMMRLTDRYYDRSVVAALFHVAENRIDWEAWRREDERQRNTTD